MKAKFNEFEYECVYFMRVQTNKNTQRGNFTKLILICSFSLTGAHLLPGDCVHKHVQISIYIYL